MRKLQRWDSFYPAEDFCSGGAEDMTRVFDVDLEQPEEVGSEDELEEGGQVNENMDFGRAGPYDLGMEHC
uniref:Uncharacterized protein n=1 Tax=Catagonus wagneri TaxID=51154 RepID=A0A8C4FDE9_9CETA